MIGMTNINGGTTKAIAALERVNMINEMIAQQVAGTGSTVACAR